MTQTPETTPVEIELPLTHPEADIEDRRAAFDDDLEWWISASST